MVSKGQFVGLITLTVILLLIINRNDGPPWSSKIEVEMQTTTLMASESILEKNTTRDCSKY